MAGTLREAAAAHGQTEAPGEDQAVLLDKVGEVATQMANGGVHGKTASESDGLDT